MIVLNKGAMFGLDARISLAIFGALSVISGAALYSAIQESRSVAKITALQEVVKALESYYIDTGSKITNVDPYPIKVLYENINSNSLWNGPYLTPTETDSSDSVFIDNTLGRVVIKTRRQDGSATKCTSSAGAWDGNHYYILIDYNQNKTSCDDDITELKRFHDKYDSDGNYNKGQFIVHESFSDATKGGVFYKLPYHLGYLD